MNEYDDTEQVLDHLMWHYIERDRMRDGQGHYYGGTPLIKDGRVNWESVFSEKRRLTRAKFVSLVHIHRLLHDEGLGPNFEHAHTVDGLVSIVIEEVPW